MALDGSWLPQFNMVETSSSFVLFFVIMATLFYEKIYQVRYDFWEETKLVLKALLFSFVIMLAVLALGRMSQEYSRLLLIMYFFGLMISMPIYKRVSKKLIFKHFHLRKKIKIIGNKEQKKILEKEFEENWYFGFRAVRSDPESIFIASKDISPSQINHFIKAYSLNYKDIYLIPYMSSINFSQSQIIELFNIKTSVIKIENNLQKKGNIFIKELFEKVAVISILPLFGLAHVVISSLIERGSKGKALFKQDRLGVDGRLFKCYKYRTMLEDSDQLLQEYLKSNQDEKEYYEIYHKYKNDPRVTRVGEFLRRTSLDELPQLINILKGEMSLIGPRPYMPVEVDKLYDDVDMILRVKPGISGLWQVSGRSNLSFEHRKNLDIWYIQNWSLWMDIVIVLKTLKVVLLKTGAS